MHQTAQSDAKESREELDSLSNLIGRLDFNDSRTIGVSYVVLDYVF
jgi:hypothetical protein